MSKDADIYIGIGVQTEQLELANTLVRELVDNLGKLQNISGTALSPSVTSGTGKFASELARAKKEIDKITPGLHGISRNMVELSAAGSTMNMVNLEKMPGTLNKVRQSLGVTTGEFTQLWGAISKASGASTLEQFVPQIQGIGKALGLSGRSLADFSLKAMGIRQAMDVGFGRSPSAAKLDTIIGDLSAGLDITKGKALSMVNTFSSAFSKISGGKQFAPMQMMGVGQLTDDLSRLGAVQDQATQVSFGMTNAHRLSAGALGKLSEMTGMSTQALQKNSQQVEQNNRKFNMMRTYMRNTRSAIGPVGYAFRDVTMQLYWASLGFLFLTMTMTRADQAALTAERRANDLSKSYYNLIQLEKTYTKVLVESGAGSGEAGEASVRLQMAQKDLELQQKSLGIAIKAEVLQGYQQILSTVPLVVNTMWMFYSATGVMNALMKTSTEVKMQDTMANFTNAKSEEAVSAAKVQNTGLTMTGIVAKVQSAVATTASAVAHGTLKASLMGSTFWASAFIGVITLGIGVIIAFASTTFMMASAEAQAAEMMKKMNAEMKEQGTKWGEMADGTQDADVAIGALTDSLEEQIGVTEEATGVLEEYEQVVAGNSVDKSALKAASAIDILNKNIGMLNAESATAQLMELTNQLDSIEEERNIHVNGQVSTLDNLSANKTKRLDPTYMKNEAGNKYDISISFGDVKISSKDDITDLVSAIDKKFQQRVHSIGGEV